MKHIFLLIMSVFYIAAGINHFWHEAFYMDIMPPWLPWQHELVMISGAFEILFGILLLFPATRRKAAWGIIVLLVAIFPANIQMMFNFIHRSDPNVWISIVRLPLQIVLIWWAYLYTKK